MYLNERSRKGITQYQLMTLCKYLKITVGLDISLDEMVYASIPSNEIFPV